MSSALTHPFRDNFMMGVEGRLFLDSSDPVLGHVVGRALYFGPTVIWKITDKIAVNSTFQPQIWGRAAAAPGSSLDLADFERAIFRVKLVVAV